MTTYIAAAANKGGVGKTMINFQLGCELARRGYHVLLVDADPQCNLSNDLLAEPELVTRSTCDIFAKGSARKTFEEMVQSVPLKELPALDLIPSSIALRKTEEELKDRAAREGVLARWLRDNRSALDCYDYVFFDTSPVVGIINSNVFAVCDSLILVSDVSENSLMGLESFCAQWDEIREDLEIDDNIAAVVFNNVNAQLNIWKEVHAKIAGSEDYGPLYLGVDIPQRAIMKRSEAERTPLCLLNPTDKAAVAIRALADALQEKGVL